MKWVFWIVTCLIAYTYFGYPLFLWVVSKLRFKPVAKGPIEPMVSLIVAAHNERPNLAQKIENMELLDYPAQKKEIIISSDGSNDGTNEFLSSIAGGGLRVAISNERMGKATALNRAIEMCHGEIVIFTDTRQQIEPSAIRRLVTNFADPTVGCVSGELEIRRSKSNSSGVGLYWRLEKVIRKLESASGSVMGATGAIYAARRELLPRFPAGLILDDVYGPMEVLRKGKRVVFEESAVAWDQPPFSLGVEFRRKVRTLVGNYQLLRIAPWLLLPNKITGLRFFSHKLLRLLSPWLLIAAYVCSAVLLPSPFFTTLFALQTVFYLAGTVALLRQWRNRLMKPAATFCLLNAAALVALFKYLRYHKNLAQLWQPTSAPMAQGASRGIETWRPPSRNQSFLTNEQASEKAALCGASRNSRKPEDGVE